MLTKNPTGPLTCPRCVVARIADVSTNETIYLALPKCRVTKIWSVLTGTIDTADAVIDAYKNAVAITGGKITIATAGSAAGDIDFCQPTALNEFDGVNDYLKLINIGASGNVVPVLVTVEYELI